MPAFAQRRKIAADLPAGKPLYLLGKLAARIDAAGEHLVLHPHSGDPMRFPLARVCRIICNRHLAWSGAALALCLAKGVPITWVDGHGRALGSAQPRHAQPQPFATLIEVYLELPDWPKRFANWLARRRLETLTTCARRAAETGHGPDAYAYESLKREFVYKGSHPLSFSADGEGWCHALAVDRLHREGLQSCYWGFGGSRLALGAELAALLWAELNLDCGSIAASADSGLVNARFFESWAHRRETRLCHHLGDLKRHLARELEAWH